MRHEYPLVPGTAGGHPGGGGKTRPPAAGTAGAGQLNLTEFTFCCQRSGFGSEEEEIVQKNTPGRA